jgi:hypothetical protein
MHVPICGTCAIVSRRFPTNVRRDADEADRRLAEQVTDSRSIALKRDCGNQRNNIEQE